MTAPSQTSSPRAVRVDAASPSPWGGFGAPTVVHLGQSALILAHRGGQLVVTSADFGLAPGGIQLTPSDFGRLRSELRSGTTGLAEWRPAVVEPVDLRMRWVSPDADAVAVAGRALTDDRHDRGIDSHAQRAAAPALIATALAGEPVTAALRGLVGAGPGSTPAGDDVVVGVLAGLHALGNLDAATTIAAALGPLLGRTTTASRHYLLAAIDGRFAERVHLLVRGLADRRRALVGARSAQTWGATSGLDLLAGVVAAAAHPVAYGRTA